MSGLNLNRWTSSLPIRLQSWRNNNKPPGVKVEMVQVVKKACLVTVIGLLGLVTASPAGAQTTKSSIEQMGGWTSCSSCAGSGGSGPTATHSMTLGTSPALSGHSAKFHLGGSRPYSNALWWKQLGASNSKTHFVYDVYFYLKAPSLSQALEFDVNQSNGSHKFIFGTECNIKGGHVWDVYDPRGGAWRSTGVHCGVPSAFKWHHLHWEFYRDGTRVHYVSVTLDGAKHYINRTYTARASGAKEINVAFQMDGDGHQDDYDTWVDKVSLKYW